MADKFKTGSVRVEFLKNLNYVDQKGNVIESLKDDPQFKKGEKATLTFRKAGELARQGVCAILDEKGNKINTKEVASQK